MQPMYYIGLDVHKRKISYCVKDGSGRIHAEGSTIDRMTIRKILRVAKLR
jgi:predicted NBD/HSP70 family sugar kinase